MVAIVHGWCGFVEKSNDTVASQMVLNKLWIPDDMINEIKDYLYINAAEVLRKFYRFHLNRSISDLTTDRQLMVDVYGRQRVVFWQTGFVYTAQRLQIQGAVCVTCGNSCRHHDNISGCCALMWDVEEEEVEMFPVQEEFLDETIPEVTWEIDVPVSNQSIFQQFASDIQEITAEIQQIASEIQQTSDEYRQIVLDNWNQMAQEEEEEQQQSEYAYYDDVDFETMREDAAEYQREIEMEARWGRLGR